MGGEREKRQTTPVVRPTVDEALTRLTNFAETLIQHQQIVGGDCCDLKPEKVAVRWYLEGNLRRALPLEDGNPQL